MRFRLWEIFSRKFQKIADLFIEFKMKMIQLFELLLPFENGLNVRKHLMDSIDEGISAFEFYEDEYREEITVNSSNVSQPSDLTVQYNLAGFLAKIFIGFLPDIRQNNSKMIKDVMWIVWMSKLRNSL